MSKLSTHEIINKTANITDKNCNIL